MSTSTESPSQSPSKPKRQKEIKIVIKAGRMQERIMSNEYARRNYMTVDLENPEGSSHTQEAIFELYEYTEQSLYSLKMMRDLNHVNILKCYTYKKVTSAEGSEYFDANVESYEGFLYGFILKKFDKLTYDCYIPSKKFADIVRAIVEVLSFLHSKQMYHGNLSWNSVLYICVDGHPIVKLAHFVKKNVVLQDAQCDDWISLASMLQEVVDIAAQNKPKDAYCIEHLSSAMTFFQDVYDLSENRRKNMSAEILNLDFFWTRQDRRNYAARIYDWCSCGNMKKLANSGIVDLPWNKFVDSRLGEALLKSMNDFNDKDGSNSKGGYNVNRIVDFFKFASGLYVHCGTIKYTPIGDIREIKGNLETIDRFMCKEYPMLFPKLRALQAQHNL